MSKTVRLPRKTSAPAPAPVTPLTQYAASEPDVVAWLTAPAQAENVFAKSLVEFIMKKGYLTPGQIGAVRRNIENPIISGEVDTKKIEAAFAKANPHLKRPKLTIGMYRFSPAPATGRNPGAVYVQHEGTYLGKIAGGKFFGRAQADQLTTILKIAADPKTAAMEHGKLTGACCACGRKLTDEESVKNAMGAVCYSRYFG